jgi:hypothetical protein
MVPSLSPWVVPHASETAALPDCCFGMDYRIYFLDDEGRIISFKGVVCESDQQAIEQARQLLEGRDAELWQQHRFVVRLNRAQ